MSADVRSNRLSSPVSCRAIGKADLEAIVGLLARGFPERSETYWRRGLERHAARGAPAGCPPFGTMLEHDGRPVGVILALYTSVERDGRSALRCNMSSWYVEPAFRAFAAMLDNVAMRNKAMTYFNISADPRTWPMHEARGFRRYSRGQIVAFPLASRARQGAGVRASDGSRDDGLPEAERRLLADHARYGCLCLVGTDADGSEPFVFIRRPVDRIKYKLGWSPLSYLHLVYCRAPANLPRFANAIGRYLLLRHATPVIVVDAVEPVPGLKGWFLDGAGTKFQRGPDPVPLGDLAYTELVLFGP